MFPEECRESAGYALPVKTDLDIHAGMRRRKVHELYRATH